MMPSARINRPSASVLSTSIVFPDMAVWMSPGFCALPPGMFSVAGRRNNFDVGLQFGERAHDAEHGGAACHVVFHFFHAVGGLDGMPPVSNVTALPTSPRTGVPGSDWRACR